MFLNSTEAWRLLFTCAGIVAGFLFAAHRTDFKQKVPLFYCWLGAIAVLGGAAAFFLPIAVNSGFAKEDDGSALRQALLYTTGGLLGVITLGETHRKNNQEKEKNENDHIRQVHAERRSRYTKAIEQLANEKAAVRLGGIYTLVGLVDEWLADESLTKDKQKEEGQVIINNLCSYIRSPYLLADKREILAEASSRNSNHVPYVGNIQEDRRDLYDEQGVRRAIFIEISNRIAKPFESGKKRITEYSNAQQIWRNFKFDVSNSQIFYRLDGLYFGNIIFDGAIFYGTADFESSYFLEDIIFSFVRFEKDVNFKDSTFGGKLRFGHPNESLESVNFKGSTFNKSAYFEALSILGEANFESSHFHGDTRFNLPFNGDARFENAHFSGFIHFGMSYFLGGANFEKAKFMNDAYFLASSFNKYANFKDAEFVHKAPVFTRYSSSDGIKYAAQFSSSAPPENYNFEVSEKENFHSIETEELYDKGKKFIIPKGCTLY